jgi:DNA-binding CsgD family transcriptional regulator/PAS domain-containing protein
MSRSGRSSDSFSRVAASIHEAALAPELWPEALKTVTDAFGMIGAAYFVWNKQTGHVDRITLHGPMNGLKAEFVNHYAAREPYRPVLQTDASGDWVRLSERLPEAVLRTDEWYNDFVVKCGIGDMLGARILDTPSLVAIFGLQQATKRAPLASASAGRMPELLATLGKAAQVDDRLCSLGWKSSVALRALDQLANAILITDNLGRVVEMNQAAERMVRLDDGLTIRDGRVGAQRGFETAKLARLVAGAAAAPQRGAEAGRMLVWRLGNRLPYFVTVVPLGVDVAIPDRPAAMVVAVDPEEHAPSELELSEFFGLTRAESRLAAALVAGKRPDDIAAASGVRITTLRTQIRAILMKVGVNKLTDLIRVMSSIPRISSRPP